MLPVYVGQRYQRGGGILSSIARFVMPTAKKLLHETVKATPRMIDSIVNDKQSVKTAVLGGLKTAGRKTARDTLNRIGVKRSRSKHVPMQQKTKRVAKRRKRNHDIFS